MTHLPPLHNDFPNHVQLPLKKINKQPYKSDRCKKFTYNPTHSKHNSHSLYNKQVTHQKTTKPSPLQKLPSSPNSPITSKPAFTPNSQYTLPFQILLDKIESLKKTEGGIGLSFYLSYPKLLEQSLFSFYKDPENISNPQVLEVFFTSLFFKFFYHNPSFYELTESTPNFDSTIKEILNHHLYQIPFNQILLYPSLNSILPSIISKTIKPALSKLFTDLAIRHYFSEILKSCKENHNFKDTHQSVIELFPSNLEKTLQKFPEFPQKTYLTSISILNHFAQMAQQNFSAIISAQRKLASFSHSEFPNSF